MRMKKLLLLLSLSLTFIFTKAQKITGLWYSSDSSRMYEIKETGLNTYTAVIKSSARKADSIGYTVLQNLTYNPHKKRYEGAIFSIAQQQPAFVKIKFDKHDSNKLVFKINRMFIMDVVIDWVRASVYAMP